MVTNPEKEKFLKLKISIIDTGCGISKKGLEHLFIDFSKLKENSERNPTGTGLGLSICKNIIQ
jgi:signal transduction histidine kinase